MRILTPAPLIDAPTQHSSPNDTLKRADTTETTSANRIPSTPTVTPPTVTLDTDVVSHNMAARLCISFLSHVLFLKNQVPFPIVQLARMPANDNTSRAAKKRQELLNSFDTLASHLYTTFVALSTALALQGSPDRAQMETGTEAASALRDHAAKDGMARAFFACALGPTVGTAKSRVMVGIDGLETRVWGLQDDDGAQTCDASEEEDDGVEGASDTDDGDEGDESESSSEEEDTPASNDEHDKASPPPSRSPSPACSSSSEPSSSDSPSNAHSKASLVPFEDPEVVRAAERLLSRTLASACAEDDGQGLASEMAPTQIHVLLRAPRRFDHPSWIPRQNLCASLDKSLDDFLASSGQVSASETKRRTKGGRVQGVWIRSRGCSTGAQIEVEDSDLDLAEEDELIWWSWDGKLVGFSDW